MHLQSSMFLSVLDVLRNEEPIHVYFAARARLPRDCERADRRGGVGTVARDAPDGGDQDGSPIDLTRTLSFGTRLEFESLRCFGRATK